VGEGVRRTVLVMRMRMVYLLFLWTLWAVLRSQWCDHGVSMNS
jgi:hypothetical protein